VRVLVTGSSGLVGRVAVAHLAHAGHQVRPFDLDDGVDLRSQDDVCRAVQGVEGVVHLAAVLGKHDENDEDFMQVNLVGTWRLLTNAVRAKVRRFVLMSSLDALGVMKGERVPDYLPLDDDHPCYPITSYALSKRLAEVLCEDLHRTAGLETVVLRPPGVWTEDTYARIRMRRADRPSYEWSPYWEYGAFIDVRDLATAIERALVVDYPGPRPFAISVDDINSSGSTARQWVARLHPGVPWHGTITGLPYATLVDNRRAKTALAWLPVHTWRPAQA
jgi:UDP-glucose 4-epimerase